jgi:predicted  nucleic acid-binding Zn-ribbon protein
MSENIRQYLNRLKIRVAAKYNRLREIMNILPFTTDEYEKRRLWIEFDQLRQEIPRLEADIDYITRRIAEIERLMNLNLYLVSPEERMVQQQLIRRRIRELEREVLGGG